MHSKDEEQQREEQGGGQIPALVRHARDDATLVSTALGRLAWNIAGDGGLYVGGSRALDPAQQLVLCTVVLTMWNACDRDRDAATAALADWLEARKVAVSYGKQPGAPTRAELARLRRLVVAVWADLQAWADAGEPA